MQEKTLQIEKIIERCMIHLDCTTRREMASLLDVSEGTISNWIKRGSIDYSLIISKCEDADLNWIFFGRGVESEKTDGCSQYKKQITEMETTIRTLSNMLNKDRTLNVLEKI